MMGIVACEPGQASPSTSWRHAEGACDRVRTRVAGAVEREVRHRSVENDECPETRVSRRYRAAGLVGCRDPHRSVTPNRARLASDREAVGGFPSCHEGGRGTPATGWMGTCREFCKCDCGNGGLVRQPRRVDRRVVDHDGRVEQPSRRQLVAGQSLGVSSARQTSPRRAPSYPGRVHRGSFPPTSPTTRNRTCPRAGRRIRSAARS